MKINVLKVLYILLRKESLKKRKKCKWNVHDTSDSIFFGFVLERNDVILVGRE